MPRGAFFQLILSTLFGCRAYESYSANISKESYEPGFKAIPGLKDLRLVTEAANDAGRRLPLLDAVRGCLGEAVDAGLGEKDWSIMADDTLKHGK